MATALQNKAAPANPLISIMETLPNIIGLFSGKSTTSTETTAPSSSTETSSIDKAGMDALIKQILDSNRGLASVTQGQRSAGLYNSSTSSLLANDLITRAAGEVAARNTTKTTTSPGTSRSTTQVTPGALQGKGTAVTGGLGALGLANKVFGANKKTPGLGNLYEAVSGRDIVGMMESGEYIPTNPLSSNSILGDMPTGYTGYADTFGLPTSSISFDAAPTAVQGFQEFFGGDALEAGYDFFSGAGGAEVVSGGADALDAGYSFLDAGGTPMFGEYVPGVGTVLGAVKIAQDLSEGNPVSSLFGTYGSAIVNAVGGDSVICTEALRQGLMHPTLYHAETIQYFPTLSWDTVDGYHFLAAPAVRWMQRSKRVARFFAAGANSYAMHTTAIKPNMLGACIKGLGEPLCSAVGKILQLVRGRGDVYGI